MCVSAQFVKDHGLQCDEQLWVSGVLCSEFLVDVHVPAGCEVGEQQDSIKLAPRDMPGGSNGNIPQCSHQCLI